MNCLGQCIARVDVGEGGTYAKDKAHGREGSDAVHDVKPLLVSGETRGKRDVLLIAMCEYNTMRRLVRSLNPELDTTTYLGTTTCLCRNLPWLKVEVGISA